MARDRKRAKQRRERGGAPTRAQAAGAGPSQPVRADVPGALDHASGEVDEFDAALVRGADGIAADPDVEPDDDLAADAIQTPGPPGGGAGGAAGGGGGSGQGPEERPSGAPLRGGNRAIGFVAIAGAYLGLADFVAKELVEAIL